MFNDLQEDSDESWCDIDEDKFQDEQSDENSY